MRDDIVGKGWRYPPQIGPNGGIALVGGETEIEQAVLIILRTAPGQRVMRPEFGCDLHALVFMPNNSDTAARVKRAVRQALGRWEPRITLRSVDVTPDPDDTARLLIDIRYEIKATHDRRSLVYPFYLIPEE
ncbi:MAG: GPW/gp25 family protein [Anaerolineae bacterium]|nr:GPW/gp25 family protein [Anaerolineae bacterium]